MPNPNSELDAEDVTNVTVDHAQRNQARDQAPGQVRQQDSNQPVGGTLPDLNDAQDRFGEVLGGWEGLYGRLPKDVQKDVTKALKKIAMNAEDSVDLLRAVAEALGVVARSDEEMEIVEGVQYLADTAEFLDDGVEALLKSADVEVLDPDDVKEDPPGGGDNSERLPLSFKKSAKNKLRKLTPSQVAKPVEKADTNFGGFTDRQKNAPASAGSSGGSGGELGGGMSNEIPAGGGEDLGGLGELGSET